MRRIAGFAALLLVVVATAPAGAAKARSAEANYNFDLSKPGASAWYGDNYGIFFGHVVTLDTIAKDRSAEISVVDDSGDQVSAVMWQHEGEESVFCGDSGRVPIMGGHPVKVQVIIDATPTVAGGCETPALPTTGKVTALFSRK